MQTPHNVSSTSRIISILAYPFIRSGAKAGKKDVDRNLLYAQIILFVSGLSTMGITIFTAPSILEGWPQLCLGIIMVLFGFMASRNPFVSLIIPCILLLLNSLGELIVAPENFASWKSASLLFLAFGAFIVKRSEKNRSPK